MPAFAGVGSGSTEGCVQQPPQRGPGRRRERKTVAHRDDAAPAIPTAPGGGDGTEDGAGVADRRTAGCVERGEPQPVARPGSWAHHLEQARRKQPPLENGTEEAGEIGRGGNDRAGGPGPGCADRAAVASGREAADDAVVLTRGIAVGIVAPFPGVGLETRVL